MAISTGVTKFFCALLCASLLFSVTCPPAFAQQPAQVSSPPVQKAQLLQFTAGGHILGFTSGGMYAATGSHVLQVDFVGASGVQPQADASAQSDGEKAASLGRVLYAGLWPGIDLAVEATSGGILSSTYQLAAGADVHAIQLRYNAPLALNPDGTLTITFDTGTANESAPVAWQVINGEKAPVQVRFTEQDHVLGFSLGQYDPRYPLTIDPILTWNTFLGSASGDDYSKGIVLDGDGNIYVIGYSNTTWGAPLRAHDSGSNYDAFIAKLDSSGALLWNTFLGGSGADYGYAIAVDGSGNVYVTGTSDAAWSCTSAACTRRSYTSYIDAFAAKVNSDGALQWNSFLGTNGTDFGYSVAVDKDGNVYVAGRSGSAWSCVPAACTVRAFTGGPDGFAAKLDSNGILLWNTFQGTIFDLDSTNAIALDESGNAYLAGDGGHAWGCSPASCTIHDPISGQAPFIAKLDSSGKLLWNTFFGGAGSVHVYAIVLDGNDNIYMTGASSDFWGCSPINCTVRVYSDGYEAFAAKMDSSGELLWNTFLGGKDNDYGYAIAVDSGGDIYVGGYSSTTWSCAPVACTVRDRDWYSYPDAFAASLDSSGVLQWNTFLGGSGVDYGYAIAVDGSRNVYVTGDSDKAWGCSPATCTGNTYSGGVDAYVVTTLTYGNFPGAFAKTAPANEATFVPTSPTLSWEASSGAIRYDYCYDTINDNKCTTWVDNGANTSVTLIGLMSDKTYYWHVRSINVGDTYADGSTTAFWSFITGHGPGAFAKISPAKLATGVQANPTLSWEASNGAIRYEYCYDTSNDNACSNWVDNDLNTSVALSGLSPSTNYYWHVRAIDSIGTTNSNGGFNAFWRFTTGNISAAFSKVAPTNSAAFLSTSPTLSWGTSAGATGYQYCYQSADNNSCATWMDNGANTSVTLSDLNPNTIYYWQVQATSIFGSTYADGSTSAPWSFTTGDAIGSFTKTAPTNSASDVLSTSTLSWGTSQGASGYEYCYDTSGDNACSNWANASTDTSVSISGLSPRTTYYWQVRAIHNTGVVYAEDSPAAFWSFTTGELPGLQLTWNTFLGGGEDDLVTAILGEDGSGNIYVGGYSNFGWGCSPDSCTVVAHTLSTYHDGFVAKLDSSGALLWNTFLGGNYHDYVTGGAVDNSGNIYVTGSSKAAWSCSPDPCTIRPYSAASGGSSAFVAKLDTNGVLQWNTFLGGGSTDVANDIVMDGSGNILVAGSSTAAWGCSPDACTKNEFSGSVDGFVARLDSNGALLWNTFLGGAGTGAGEYAIALDHSGSIYVTGASGNSSWSCIPIDCTVRAYSGGSDAFVAKLDPSGGLQWNTFLGSNESDGGFDIAVDGASNVYVVGVSNGAWGCSPGNCTLRPYTRAGGVDKAFVARLDSSGVLQWNTFLSDNGQNGYDEGIHIMVDGNSHVYTVGYSIGAWGCSPLNCTLRAYSGNYDAYLASLDSSGVLLWNAFLGGDGYEEGHSLAMDSRGNIYLAGLSADAWGCSPEPCTVRPYTSNSVDGFVAALHLEEFPGDFGKTAPTNAAAFVSTGPTLSWGPSSGAAGYEYCYETSHDGDCTAWAGNGASTSATLDGLSPNTTYYWQVRANNTSGVTYADGSPTALRSFTTGAGIGSFVKTAPAGGAAFVSTSPTLSWGTSTGASGYEYCYEPSDDNDCAPWIDNGANTSIKLSGLSNDTTYYWQVRASSSAGVTYAEDSPAALWSFTPAQAPGLILSWNTFLGSSGTDNGYAIAADGSGNTYVVGYSSAVWGCSPVSCTVRAYSGGYDTFVAKLDASGALLWNAFLGSSASDYGVAVALDESGNIFVAGLSSAAWGCSPAACTVRAYSAISPAFVAKLDSSGALQWNTFLGGGEVDNIWGIAPDKAGNIYLIGTSEGPWGCAPVACTNHAYSGGSDTVVAKLDSSGALQWNSFLGSSTDDESYNSIAVDTSGGVYVAGSSLGAWGCMPAACTVRAHDPGAYSDAFVAKLDSTGELQWNTFLGGSQDDGGSGIAVDSTGSVSVVGSSYASWGCSLVACTVRAFSDGSDDAFVARLDPDGALLWNTFLGGSEMDAGAAIALDEGGNIFVAGTSSTGWGCAPEACTARPYSAAYDTFVAFLDSSGGLRRNTFLGGGGMDYNNAIAVDGSLNVYLIGNSNAAWGCSPAGCTMRSYSADTDAAVVKLQPEDFPGSFDKTAPLDQASGVAISPTLSWGTSRGTDSYEYCYIATDDSPCSNWVNAGAGRQVSLSGLSPNTTYAWQVRAVNGLGVTYADGGPTATWSFTTGSVPGTFVKTSPTHAATGVSNTPTLFWAGSVGAVHYEYCFAAATSDPCSHWLDAGADTRVTLAGLSNHTSYNWQVRAVNDFGVTYADGDAGALWSFTTGDLPGAFSKIGPANGVTNLPTSLAITWETSSDATRYEYCYDATNDNACSNWVDAGAHTSAALSGLNPKTTYYWQVRAVNSFGVTYAEGSPNAFWSFATYLKKLFFPILARG